MSISIAIALTTAILSGLWGWVAISLGLLIWAGFLGCTTYFASPIDGIKGLKLSIITNLSGVFWAMVIIQLSTVFNFEILGYIITALVTFMMCFQANKSWLNYIPGTFIGCCATFAAEGNWQVIIPSLLLGSIFGYSMKASGLWLHKRANQNKTTMQTQQE